MNFLLRNMGLIAVASPCNTVSMKTEYCSTTGRFRMTWLNYKVDGDVCVSPHKREWTNFYINNRFLMCSRTSIPRRKVK